MSEPSDQFAGALRFAERHDLPASFVMSLMDDVDRIVLHGELPTGDIPALGLFETYLPGPTCECQRCRSERV